MQRPQHRQTHKAVHPRLKHHPQINRYDAEKSGVQKYVPGEYGSEVVVCHGNNQPIWTSQLKPKH